MLQVQDLHVRYGVIEALRGVTVSCSEGEIVPIVGANGAGKSTLLGTVAGIRKPYRGRVLFQGQPLPSRAHEVVRLGVALVPEGRRIFGNLTVYENLMMGAFLRRERAQVDQDLERVFALFPRLKERLRQQASTLSGGEQQMLAIARGLMSRPRLLLLDEPSLGLAPILVQEIFRALRDINRAGTTILLVEQNARQALLLAHRGYVLRTGTVVLGGEARSLLADPEVQAAYLGQRRRSPN
mgnify:CR=1 FL=1